MTEMTSTVVMMQLNKMMVMEPMLRLVLSSPSPSSLHMLSRLRVAILLLLLAGGGVVSSSSSSPLVVCGGDDCYNLRIASIIVVVDVDLDTGLETIAEDTDGDKDDGAADIMMVMMFRVMILEVGNRKVIRHHHEEATTTNTTTTARDYYYH